MTPPMISRAAHESRVSELLQANNGLLRRARAAEEEASRLRAQHERLFKVFIRLARVAPGGVAKDEAHALLEELCGDPNAVDAGDAG